MNIESAPGHSVKKMSPADLSVEDEFHEFMPKYKCRTVLCSGIVVKAIEVFIGPGPSEALI